MDTNSFIKDGIITVFFDSAIYSKDALLKCLYWYGDKFIANLSMSLDDKHFQVVLQPKPSEEINIDDLQNYLAKVQRDAIDFQIRQVVQAETQNIRDLLVAKAFSHGEYDELPSGSISDPIGFDPEKIQQ